jgi:transcriptional regulator with XRE-family HTH domain
VAGNRVTGLTGCEAGVSGRVAGAVLRAVRSQVGLTQADLAERLDAGLTTVQGWETGRRPLVNVRYGELQRIRRTLQAAGARPSLLRVWDQALTADSILEWMDTRDPQAHPLAWVVPDRTLTELLAWPISGSTPRELVGLQAQLHVESAVRDHLATHLRDVSDQVFIDGITGAMLRRQAKYLVAKHRASGEWVKDALRRDACWRVDLSTWSPAWPVARSNAVSAALAGDLDPLLRFTREGLASEQNIHANLTYWAYWVGEINVQWGADADMVTAGSYPWSGEMLAGSLVKGLVGAPYRELCAHTLWSLLMQKRRLIANASVRGAVSEAVEVALSTTGVVSELARNRLDQVRYLLGVD